MDLRKIVDFIVKTVQEESDLSGFQYVVAFETIEKEFNIILDQKTIIEIVVLLYEKIEVACCEIDSDIEGFDVVLYTDFAPNYQEDNISEVI